MKERKKSAAASRDFFFLRSECKEILKYDIFAWDSFHFLAKVLAAVFGRKYNNSVCVLLQHVHGSTFAMSCVLGLAYILKIS